MTDSSSDIVSPSVLSISSDEAGESEFVLINCFFYSFWMRRAELDKFRIESDKESDAWKNELTQYHDETQNTQYFTTSVSRMITADPVSYTTKRLLSKKILKQNLNKMTGIRSVIRSLRTI